METIHLLSILIICVIFFILTFKSSFGNIESSFGNVEQVNCFGNNPVNVFPRGHLPGSEIILTESERRGLLKRFVDNGTDQFI